MTYTKDRRMDYKLSLTFYRKDVQENLRKEKQDLATMKRNCRAIKQKNQKLEKELRKQNKKVGILKLVIVKIYQVVELIFNKLLYL